MSRFSSYLVQLTADVFQRFSSGSQASLVTRFSRTESTSSHSFMSRQSVLAFLLVLLTTVFGVGNAWGEDVTMSYSAGTTTNMGAGNNASSVGLDATLWMVTADKGGQNNYPGLNKKNYIALYAGSNNSANGASITISILSGTISSISIDYYNQNSGVVHVGNATISPSNGIYTINNSSFSIKNELTTGQVQINSITINYSPSGSTEPANYNIPKFAVSIPSGTIGVRCSQHSLRQHTLSHVYALSY